MEGFDLEGALRNAALFAVPFLFSLSFHEMAHAWVADRKGDSTGRLMGRVTLNPIAHIDSLGTVIFPLLCLLLGGFFFGWAKPVPVNASNLRSPLRDMALISLAGPLSNLILAIGFALLLGGLAAGGGLSGQSLWWPLGAMLARGILLNLFLGFFNLLPLSPLDGASVAIGFLPSPLSEFARGIAPYGGVILILLWFSGLIRFIVYPVFSLLHLILDLTGALFSTPLVPLFNTLLQM